MVKISPSLLSADFSKLGEEVKKITEAGADLIHFDVMDGHFVPNITFGPLILKSIRKFTHLPLEAHLMITNPEKYWKEFADSGADIIGIHIECKVDHLSIIKEIQQYGKKACIVINPPTPVEKIYPVLKYVDMVLIMTVNPGFGGQKFIYEVVEKIRKVDEYRKMEKLDFEIEVDGGINRETSKIVIENGADILVSGFYIFSGKDYKERIESLRWKK
ncbi:MAG: ribulose-phosphate 3-epimerase [Candidatus Omnitrophica bacterium]|nr:ribulose-phosphate 3-epimerase [Candidatus Omnitrophota bacterium]MCM8806596.1 ribulose-phosphate 3-epimerase [Candidatus Omnitrophota bacterium]